MVKEASRNQRYTHDAGAVVHHDYAGGTEQEISLESGPIWIYLTYQTAFVDDAGKLQIRRDLYNLDSRMLAAIKDARAIASLASEGKSEPTMATPAPAAPAHRRKAAQRADQVATRSGKAISANPGAHASHDAR